MHSMDVLYHDPEAYGGDGEVFSVAHNGDFSGDVVISMNVHRVLRQLGDHAEIEIPFHVLKRIVAEAVRSARIGSLEDADDNQLLGVDLS